MIRILKSVLLFIVLFYLAGCSACSCNPPSKMQNSCSPSICNSSTCDTNQAACSNCFVCAQAVCDQNGCNASNCATNPNCGQCYLCNGTSAVVAPDDFGQSTITNQNGGIIANLVDSVQTRLSSSIQSIYTNIVQNSVFINIVQVSLLLYVVLISVMFTMGLTQFTQKDLLIHLIKFALVATVVSPESWDFFSSDFINLFFYGSLEIISIIFNGILGKDASTFIQSSSTSQPLVTFGFVDQFITTFVNWPVSIKIRSVLLLYMVPNLIVILMLCVMIIKFMCLVAQAIIKYLIALLAITFLLTLTPIFIVCLLFSFTKEFFYGWLSQLINYMFQPIFIFTVLAMMIYIVMQTFYKALGFQACVCAKGWGYFSWAGADPASGIDLSKTSNMPMPGFYVPDVSNPGSVCAPYTCTAERYLDLPFLNPGNEIDLYIAKIFADSGIEFSWFYMALELIIGYLLLGIAKNIIDKVPDIAKIITNSTYGHVPDIGNVYGTLSALTFGPINNMLGAYSKKASDVIGQKIRQTGLGRSILKPYDYINASRNKIGGAIESAGKKINTINPVHNINKKIKLYDEERDETRDKKFEAIYKIWDNSEFGQLGVPYSKREERLKSLLDEYGFTREEFEKYYKEYYNKKES
jgi:type IV secretory pathway VirB6-like protein